MSYIIKKGDTLSGIAQNSGTTVSALMQANPYIKNADKIYAGSTLNLDTVNTDGLAGTVIPKEKTPKASSNVYLPTVPQKQGLDGTAQPVYRNTEEDRVRFVNDMMPHASSVAKQLGTAPENILAQWVAETGWGSKVLPGSYNLGNIKAGSSWTGDTVGLNALEYDKNNKPYNEASQFRKYKSWAEGAKDYGNFLANNSRYAQAIGKKDPMAFFSALQKSGYATDPNYARNIVNIVDSVRNRMQV